MDMKKNGASGAIDEKRLDFAGLLRALDSATDEIFIVDEFGRTAYISRASQQHYGLDPRLLLGKTMEELAKTGYAYPFTVTPHLMDELSAGGRRLDFLQTTQLGKKIYSSATPVFGDGGRLEYVVMNVRELGAIRSGLDNFSHLSTFDEHKRKALFLPNRKPKRETAIIAESPVMREVLDLADQVGEVDSNVLITGESGTGKSLLAHYIHDSGKRRGGPFMSINCAAIPEGLLESELFGYAAGAFTGAHKGGKPGLVELADKGTLFLDEISEMPMPLQAKLLQLIQEKQYIPVGGSSPKKVDTRIIVASNQDLLALIGRRQFRKDLYYRLNVIEIRLPQLKERPEDVKVMIRYFLEQFDRRYQREHRLDAEAMDCLLGYSWPGNVRELENILERLAVTKRDPLIRKRDLPAEVRGGEEGGYALSPAGDCLSLPLSLDEAMDRFEGAIIARAKKTYGSTRKIARGLKISQSRAVRLLQKHQLSGEEAEEATPIPGDE